MLRSKVVWMLLAGAAIGTFAMLPLRAQDEAKPEAKPAEAKAPEILRFASEDEPDNESLVHEALDQYVSLQFKDLPLRALAEAVAKKCDISIVLNEQSLTDEGVATDTPITLNVSRVTLRSALKLALDPLQLRAIVDDEVLMITTAADAVNHLNLVVYDVTDLEELRHKEKERGYSHFLQAIQDSTGGEPDGPWMDVDGEGGTMSLLKLGDADLLAIRQTEAVHRQIEQFLSDTRAALEREDEEEEPVIATTAAAVEKRLHRRVNVNFDDVSWQTAVKTLAAGIGVVVQIDGAIDGGTPVTLRAKDTQASTIFERLLKPRQLGWQVTDMGLRIATTEALDREPEVQVYDVVEFYSANNKEFDFEGLIEVIKTIEGPAEDGPRMAAAGMLLHGMPMLVVKTTRERQSRISLLFKDLRSAQERAIRRFPGAVGRAIDEP
ncbi:MAG TPA: hypothetical protein VHB77_21985 [Planctomycetaceae bacterium]|nr:hypothetical protein [Planctomycetaceae bacterium]